MGSTGGTAVIAALTSQVTSDPGLSPVVLGVIIYNL